MVNLHDFYDYVIDDLGYGDLGVYPNPNNNRMRLKTPNIDGERHSTHTILCIVKCSFSKGINDVY